MSEKKDSESAESVATESATLDVPVDREQNFATSFDDSHVVAELNQPFIPGIDNPPTFENSLIHETTEAVQELVGIPGISPVESTDPSVKVYGYDQENSESATAVAKVELFEKFFSLILSELKFDLLVEEILKSLVKAVDAQAGSVLELDQNAKEFFFRASFGGGDPEALKAFRVPAYSGIVGHVAESRESLMIQDLNDSEMHLKSISMSVGFETKSCIAVPILIANQLYGVVEVFNKIGAGYFDAKDRQLLEDSVKMAAKVLEVRFFAAEILKRKAG